MEHVKWIFSGIGVLLLSLVIGCIAKYIPQRKNKETLKRNNANPIQRVINQHGDKPIYIEKNDGDITID